MMALVFKTNIADFQGERNNYGSYDSPLRNSLSTRYISIR